MKPELKKPEDEGKEKNEDEPEKPKPDWQKM